MYIGCLICNEYNNMIDTVMQLQTLNDMMKVQ